jgi:2-succinyl-6-hydroxy-2,4-cyclohexadiene-1-carboxylate synthase
MIIELNGVSYSYKSYGNGFPLVLLHGFTGNGATWEPFLEDWKEHSRLIMVDIIGHGETEAPEQFSRYQMELVVADLDSLLDQLHIDQADFLGYSMGGRLALAYVAKYPEKVRKLILESASPGLKTEAERIERTIQDKALTARIREQGIEAFVDYWEEIPLFRSQKNLPPFVREQIRRQRLTNSPIGLAGSLIGMGTGAQPSLWDHLEGIDNEVLLISGELDQKFCMIAAEMQKMLKNCQSIVINDCGHAIHVEQVEKFGTIVGEFLKNGSVND